MKKISLIFTLFNEGESIRRLLGSIERQTKLPDEIVIVDAGSKDDTVGIIREWKKSVKLPVNLIIKAGANISRGRNRAISEAKHTIIAVTDGGCELDKHWLERITNPLQAEGLDVVYGGTVAKGHSLIGRLFAAFYFTKTHTEEPTNTEHSARSMAFRRDA